MGKVKKKITILCSDPMHPINNYLTKWVEKHNRHHDIDLIRKKSELTLGDILFLVSCSEIVTLSEMFRYKFSLVLHASDLPQGRGWSPHVWEIVAGAKYITLTLIEAREKVDSGNIWKKVKIKIPPAAIWSEINELLFTAEIKLIDFAIKNSENIKPIEQSKDIEPTYYKKRTPVDSKIDPHKSIAEQFDLIRVCDPNRFPAFFEYLGREFNLEIKLRS